MCQCSKAHHRPSWISSRRPRRGPGAGPRARLRQQVRRSCSSTPCRRRRRCRVAGGDRLRREHHRLQPGAADLVDGGRRRPRGSSPPPSAAWRAGFWPTPGRDDVAHEALVDGGRLDARRAATASRTTSAPSCGAVKSFSAPRNLPVGTRTALTMTAGTEAPRAHRAHAGAASGRGDGAGRERVAEQPLEARAHEVGSACSISRRQCGSSTVHGERAVARRARRVEARAERRTDRRPPGEVDLGGRRRLAPHELDEHTGQRRAWTANHGSASASSIIAAVRPLVLASSSPRRAELLRPAGCRSSVRAADGRRDARRRARRPRPTCAGWRWPRRAPAARGAARTRARRRHGRGRATAPLSRQAARCRRRRRDAAPARRPHARGADRRRAGPGGGAGRGRRRGHARHASRRCATTRSPGTSRPASPYDKAGALRHPGAGVALRGRIEGSYPNVVGLPVELVCRRLDRSAPARTCRGDGRRQPRPEGAIRASALPRAPIGAIMSAVMSHETAKIGADGPRPRAAFGGLF